MHHTAPALEPHRQKYLKANKETFSLRACARTRTRAGAAIFVQIGAENFPELACRCVPKSFLRYVSAQARPHIHSSFFSTFFSIFMQLNFFLEKLVGAGSKSGVRVRAPHPTKMCVMCVQVWTKIRAH